MKIMCQPCEFQVPENAPEKVLRSVGAWGKLSACGLRLLGHPGLLAIAEALHGPDFCPFSGANEEMIVKVAGLAPSVAWCATSLKPPLVVVSSSFIAVIIVTSACCLQSSV